MFNWCLLGWDSVPCVVISFKTTLPGRAIWSAKENYIAITQIKLCRLCVFEMTEGWDLCWGEGRTSRWFSGILITLFTLRAVCCCHTAILFSAFALGNLNKKRPFKGRFITLEKSNQGPVSATAQRMQACTGFGRLKIQVLDALCSHRRQLSKHSVTHTLQSASFRNHIQALVRQQCRFVNTGS